MQLRAISRRGGILVRTLLCMLLIAGSSMAGEFNKVLSVGDAAPAFANLIGTDEKAHALKDYSAGIVVILFTCNSCPVAQDYEERTIALAKKFAGKVQFLAINSNMGPDESLRKMAERAKKKEYPYAYLADPDGAVAKAYGAQYTPEYFVLNQDRKVSYLGALDDKNKAADAKVDYLAAAIDAALAGNAAMPAETLARGCKIKFKK
jgi:peroxiredoxin